jgi:hypothetical protein
MRTILSAAAAGALIIGSAAGAMAAKPDTTMKGVMKVRMANVHNGSFELNSTAPVTVRAKVNVWDSVKTAEPTSVTITLAQYDKKGGTMITPGLTATSVMATNARLDKKSKNYYADIDLSSLKASVTAVPVTLCLYKVELVGTNVKEQKRQVTKKVGTDCITVVNTPSV